MKKVLISTIMIAIALSSGSGLRAITYKKFDKNHSTIGFRTPIFGGFSSVEGKFTKFDIVVVHDEDSLELSSVRVTIDAASINTGNEERDAHLRTGDFLDVDSYPEITFISERIEKRSDGYVAVGKFTLRGVTKTVELSFEIKGVHHKKEGNKYMIGIKANTAIDRQDYGVEWRHPDPLFVGDSVFVEINLISRATRGVVDSADSTDQK